MIANAFVCGVLCAVAMLLVFLAAVHSPTPDEITQLPAGLHTLEFRRFELGRASPPLVRLTAAIPVFIAGYRPDWHAFDPSPGARSEYYVGPDFVDANVERTRFLFTIARWACIPFTLIGCIVCWKWASEMYGRSAGLLALVLWSFCPNVLGNGGLMTPDVACASLGVLAGYLWWRWLRAPSWWTATFCGAALALACLTKGTWLILIGLWPALYLLWSLMAARLRAPRQCLLEVAQLTCLALVALLLLNAAYLFQDTCVPLRQYEFVSAPFRERTDPVIATTKQTSNRFRDTTVGMLPVPVPMQFLLGIDTQWAAFDRGGPAYLLGIWRYGGWWYYYLVAMAVKIPLGAWVLAGVVIVNRFRDPTARACWRDEIVLLAPAIAALLFISLKGGINRHFRYVLPAMPFLYVWLGSAAPMLTRPSNLTRLLIGGSTVWFMASSLLVFPHSQSYFNELCGGPRGGPRVLLGSSVEWGQDLYFLKAWIREHPEAEPLFVGWHPPALHPRQAGIDKPSPPTRPSPGWYAVSMNRLYEADSPCAYLQNFQPVDHVAYSVNIYHLTEHDLRALREKREIPDK